jgi:chemotaxis signal transduction protein
VNADQGIAGGLLQLREDFDRQFTEAVASQDAGRVDLLTLELGGHLYAVRLSDIAYLAPGPALAPMASEGSPAFLGLAGLRGAIVPVWDLAGLAGYPVLEGRRPWVLGCAGSPHWAAAVGGLVGTLRVPGDAVREREREDQAGPVRTVCMAHGTARTVLDLRALSQSLLRGNRA